MVKQTRISPFRRGSKEFLGAEDPLSNASAGIGLPAMAECAEASARYHAQDGRLPGKAVFCVLLAVVACVSWVRKNGLQEFEVK